MRKSLFAILFTLLLAFYAAAGEASAQPEPAVDELPKVANGEKFEFQAEVSRMMKLIIHSLYKTKEIFLRELISNASDALDKIRFLSLTDSEILGIARQLNITIKSDRVRKTLTIRDTGIGMTKTDMVKNLGTIAKSGTAEFLQSLEKKGGDTSNLIGQFGVGFYSAFLVADKVTVISKHNDDKQHIWESYADGDFSVVEDPRGDTLGRGTSIVLHVKSDAENFLDESRLERIIRKYSEFINFPIYLQMNKTEEVEVPLDEEELAAEEERAQKEREAKKKVKEEKSETEGEEAEVEDVEDEEPVEIKKTKKEKRSRLDWTLMNTHKPIWTRDPKNVTESEYASFFKSYFKDNEDPLHSLHFKAEGDVDFKSILFIPGQAPPMLLQNPDNHIKAIKLYVRRVFITDELLEFLPKYLGFLKGIVDSDDLPLNVSRETLQQHRLLRVIKKKIIQKALEMMRRLAEDPVKYDKFLKQYGTSLKVGALEDEKNRKKILRLLRFQTSNSESKKASLDDYVSRMKEGQEQIYYMTGASLYEIKHSPFVERVLARGYEVIYADEPIDEYLMQHAREFGKYQFQHVAKEGLKLGDDDLTASQLEELTDKFKPLAKYFETVLGSKIERVNISVRLTESPCALVAAKYGWTGNMEKLMASQSVGANQVEQQMHQYALSQKRTLEINPRHPIIKNLLEKITKEEQDEETDDLVKVLFDTAMLRSGFAVKDMSSFASRIEEILRSNLGIDPDEEVEKEEIKKAEPKAEPEKKDEKAEEELFADEDTIEEHHHDEL